MTWWRRRVFADVTEDLERRTNQILWVDTKSTTSVLIKDRGGSDRDTKEKAMERWKQRLELCSCKPSNAWPSRCWNILEALSCRVSRGSPTWQAPWFQISGLQYRDRIPFYCKPLVCEYIALCTTPHLRVLWHGYSKTYFRHLRPWVNEMYL